MKIGDLDGEFVQGTFVLMVGESSATRNPSAPILRLRWMKDDTWFELTKFGDVEAIEYLDQAGMIALAESLTSQPWTISEEKRRSPFKATASFLFCCIMAQH